MCYPLGTSITLLGKAFSESVVMSDGSTKKVWMLSMDPPLCVIDKRFSRDPQGRVSVPRLGIVGLVPPAGKPITVVGTLNASNTVQYFIIPSQLYVVPPNVRLAPH